MTVEEYMSLPLDEDILIKYSYKDKEGNEALSGYYVVNKTIDGPDDYGRYMLTEAKGEQCSCWNIEDVESWVLCKELDKFFEAKNQMEIHKDDLPNIRPIVKADKAETPSKTEMALGRGKEIKDEYEYHMSVPVSGRLDAHVISETPLTKEEVMQRAFESANFGELEDCDIDRETDIDELYFEGEAADEERGDYE